MGPHNFDLLIHSLYSDRFYFLSKPFVLLEKRNFRLQFAKMTIISGCPFLFLLYRFGDRNLVNLFLIFLFNV